MDGVATGFRGDSGTMGFESILMTTSALEQLLANAVSVLKSEGAAEVYVFGSGAKGTWRPGSDIDLAVTGLPARRYYHAVGRLLKALRCPVDLIALESDSAIVRAVRASGSLRRVG